MAFRVLMCSGVSLLASGCSLSFPIASFVDTMPTGSIDRSSALLSEQLDQEDWRRARAALAVALDPQGNGATVAWDNPSSGAKGSFLPIAPALPKNDKVCRAFQAHVAPTPHSERDVEGSACRGPDGAWVVAEAHERRRAKG